MLSADFSSTALTSTAYDMDTKKPPKSSKAKFRRLQVRAEKDALRNQSKEKHHDVARVQADSAGEGSSSLSSNTMMKKALGEPWVM